MKRAILLAALVTGCGEVRVEAITVPPPGKTAELDADNHRLHLSLGVAFAFECTEYNNDGYNGPCRRGEVSSSSADVASIFPSYLDSLAPAYDGADIGPRSRAAFVVVGLAAGDATVRVATADDDVAIDVTVLP